MPTPNSNMYTFDSEGRPVPTLWAFIESSVTQEVKSAQDYTSKVQEADRQKRWDRYYGRPFGNEKKGRSKFMSRDILETIEWIMPSLMSTFVSEDPKVEITIEGQPPIVGEAVMKKIQQDLNDDDERSLYILFYQWFKDALISDTSFVGESWLTLTESELIRIPQANSQQMWTIYSSDELQLQEYTDNGDGTYSDIDILSESVTEDRLDVNNLPHWDVLVTENARYINDEYGKGYKSRVSLDYLMQVNEQYREENGEDFFQGLEKLKAHAGRRAEGDSSEEIQYMGNEGEFLDSSYPSESTQYYNETNYVDPKIQVNVVQWYTRIDVDGDGLLEDIICWVGENTVLLRWERNPDNATMMSALSPIIDCYKFFGIAYSELILDLQNLKTMLIRRILDNFDFSTLGRTFIRPGAKVPIRELLQNIPGDTIMADPERVRTEYPKPFDSRVLQLLEYVDGMKENRTGSTRYNQGTDADALNKTAAGMSMIQTASQKRIDMIARLFAETGIRDMYKKCVILLRNNLTSPFTVRVNGQPVTVQPEQLKGKIRCVANLGVEAQIGMMEAQKIQGIFTFLSTINQIFPGILGPEQVHTLATKFVANMGNKEPESYVAVLAEFLQSLKVTQEQAQQAQQLEMQVRSIEAQAKLLIAQAKAKEVGVEQLDVELDARTRMATKQMDIDQKDRAGKLRFVVDMAQVMVDKQKVAAQARSQPRAA